MNKTAVPLLTTPILFMMLILGINTEASAEVTKDVVLMGCSPTDPAIPGPPLVSSLGSSTDDIPLEADIGENCAVALAALLNDDFEIRKISDINFTLIRKN